MRPRCQRRRFKYAPGAGGLVQEKVSSVIDDRFRLLLLSLPLLPPLLLLMLLHGCVRVGGTHVLCLDRSNVCVCVCVFVCVCVYVCVCVCVHCKMTHIPTHTSHTDTVQGDLFSVIL